MYLFIYVVNKWTWGGGGATNNTIILSKRLFPQQTAQPMGISLFPTRGTVSNPTTPFSYNISRCVSRSTLYTSGLTESSTPNPREQASSGPGLPQRGENHSNPRERPNNLLRHRQHCKLPAPARQIPLLWDWYGATKVHRFAPIASLQGDFGWLRPRLKRYKIMLNYWNRLVKINDSWLSKYLVYDLLITNYAKIIGALNGKIFSHN